MKIQTRQFLIETAICAIGLVTLLFVSGCSTVPVTPGSYADFVKAHRDTLTRAAAALSSFAISKAEKDPVARQELKEDINSIVDKVARGLDAAAASADGSLDPDQLAADLKARDPDVQTLLDGVVAIYQGGYQRLQASGKAADTIPWARAVLNTLRTLADGLNKATS